MIGNKEKREERDHGWLLSVGAVVAVLILWWVLAELEIWDPLFLPHPADVWRRFIESITTNSETGKRGLSNYFLWEHLWASLWRLIQGIFFALLIGIPLG